MAKGHGRTPGSKNKTTEEIRKLFQQLISANMDTLQKDLDEMSGEKRIKAITEIAKFVIPTLKSVDAKVDMAGVIVSFKKD